MSPSGLAPSGMALVVRRVPSPSFGVQTTADCLVVIWPFFPVCSELEASSKNSWCSPFIFQWRVAPDWTKGL